MAIFVFIKVDVRHIALVMRLADDGFLYTPDDDMECVCRGAILINGTKMTCMVLGSALPN